MQNIFDIDILEVVEVVIRSLLSLLTLFFITKMLGKKQVSQLSLFDYVIGISIGNFAAEISINTDTQYLNGVVAVSVFGLVALLVSVMTMKSIRLRRFFMGTPTVLIQRGKIIERNLRKVKFDINDLLEECRNSGYFDISQIDTALMEVNGKLSVMLKSDYQNPTMKDMKLKSQQQWLCSNVIIDGHYMNKNLNNMNKDLKWLNHELEVKGYQDIDNILLATLDINDKIIVYEKNVQDRILNVLE